MANSRGLSLIELAAVLAVVGILATAGAPSLARFAAEQELAAAARTLYAALHQARGAALSHAATVAWCVSEDATRCRTGAPTPAASWMVFVDATPSSPVQFSVGDRLLSSQTLNGVRVHSSRSALNFWPGTRAGTTATLLLCPPRALAEPRAVIVSQTGRPRIARIDALGAPLRCP